MPAPKPTETKKEYIRRCMMDDKMISQFPDTDQRFAVCNSYWDEKNS